MLFKDKFHLKSLLKDSISLSEKKNHLILLPFVFFHEKKKKKTELNLEIEAN